jgi:hypothetical protein
MKEMPYQHRHFNSTNAIPGKTSHHCQLNLSGAATIIKTTRLAILEHQGIAVQGLATLITE